MRVGQPSPLVADVITWTYLGALALVGLVAFRDAPQRLRDAVAEGRLLDDRVYHVVNVLSVLVLLAWLVCVVLGLDARWLPEASWRSPARLGGLYLAWLGFAVSVAARLTLAGAFAPSAAVPADGTVVDRGPYALVRHPFYLGLLVGMVGGTVALDSLATVVALALTLPLVHVIAIKEEAQLVRELGEPYERYRDRVPRWIPWVGSVTH